MREKKLLIGKANHKICHEVRRVDCSLLLVRTNLFGMPPKKRLGLDT